MAARKTTSLSEAWREKIKTSMLINRLQDHVFGRVELTKSQVSAALGLLKKTAPDLSAVDHSGDVTQTHYVARVPPISPDMETWQRQHSETPKPTVQ